MMLKYSIQNKAEPGTHALPFYASSEEAVLSTIIIPEAEPQYKIIIEAVLEWENPLLNWDIGELDVRLRRNSTSGPVLQWTQESCYERGIVRLSFEDSGPIPEGHIYCLTVQSVDNRACVTGPVELSAHVYAPNV